MTLSLSNGGNKIRFRLARNTCVKWDMIDTKVTIIGE